MQAGYTEEQKQTIKEQFKLRRTRQLFLAVPFIAAIFSLAAGESRSR